MVEGFFHTESSLKRELPHPQDNVALMHSGSLGWSPMALHSVQFVWKNKVKQLSSVRQLHRRKNAKKAPVNVSLSATRRFRGTCKNKRTPARTPTLTPMREYLKAPSLSKSSMERAAEHMRSMEQRAADDVPHKNERGLFCFFSEGTVSETSNVTPRQRVTRLRRTSCVHQKARRANDSIRKQ